MKVKLINEDKAKDLFKDWGIFAKVCYDTKTSKPEIIGKHCLKSGHFSGSRSAYFVFLVEDVPRFCVDQIIRAEQGVCKNVQSFRYVSKNSFVYEKPIEILDNESLLTRYNQHMEETMQLYEDIQDYVYIKTNNKERANEQARYVLPISTHSSFVIGVTVEALIHLCNLRLCVRTEDISRKLAIGMRDEVLEILPELKDELVPKCQSLLWCPEGKSCGAYPTKKELMNLIQIGKNMVAKGE